MSRMSRAEEDDSSRTHRVAAQGLTGGGRALPFADRIQRAFGPHDISGVVAHTDASAIQANDAMGSLGYATGHHVAFRGAPDLHTAAHEAAHVIQQRAGISLKGGGAIGSVADSSERHADAVADRVVQGNSAEDLLASFSPHGGRTRAVQRRDTVQHQTRPRPGATDAALSEPSQAGAPAAEPDAGRSPRDLEQSPETSPQQPPRALEATPEPATTGLPTATQRGQAEALRARARTIRDQLDQQAQGGGTPDPGMLAQLRSLRAQQLPIWRAIVTQLRTIVDAEAPAADAPDTRGPPSGSAHGSSRRSSRTSSRRARRRPPAAAPASEARRALDEATERVARLERAAARDRLREIEGQLRQAGGSGSEALTSERARITSGMGHFRRMSQGDSRWAREEFRGNRGQSLYNRSASGQLRAATIQAGGCGPLSLAMVMAFYERENPEAELRGERDLVHEAVERIQRMGARGEGARVSDGTTTGSAARGTDWNRVANGIGGQMANIRGSRVAVQDIAETLRSGRQVVWQKRRPAHFVVISSLRGGEGANMRFHVSDPGFADHDVTLAEIRANREGTWVLTTSY
jgi:hypothetical protein